MKLPRDMDAARLIKILERLGYRVLRQTGSHIRLQSPETAHTVTIPNHRPLRVGTLAAIISDVASKQHMDRAELIALISR